MPLTQTVSFKKPLEANNKIQIPKIIRWQFKLEPTQVLRVSISGLAGGQESFYTKMSNDGRIYIPKTVLFAAHGKQESLAHYLITITLEPA